MGTHKNIPLTTGVPRRMKYSQAQYCKHELPIRNKFYSQLQEYLTYHYYIVNSLSLIKHPAPKKNQLNDSR